jgi:hypothetical protein
MEEQEQLPLVVTVEVHLEERLCSLLLASEVA